MKTRLTLVLGLLAIISICHAQFITVTNLGMIPVDSYGVLGVTNSDSGSQTVQIQVNVQPMTPPTPPVIAELITPEIQALADGLQDNPLQIFNFVHDHIRYVHYFGSKKGAELTYLEKSGNDFDQCALLVAMLRAAGYSSASYQFGWMLFPYDNPDGSHRDLHHWLNLDLTNSNWSTTTSDLNYFMAERGFPTENSSLGNNIYAFQRVWVTVNIGGTNYNLDPAFKVTERILGLNLPSAMGFSSNALMTAAGGLDVGDYTTNFYTTNLNEAVIRSTLAGYTTNLLNFIQNNCPNYTVAQVLSGQYIVPSTNTVLPQSLLFPATNMNGTMPIISWVNEPTNMMSTMSVSFLGTNYQWFFPQLQGGRLSLTMSSGGLAQLWFNDTNVASGNTGGGSGQFNLTVTAYHPGILSTWNTTSNVFNPGSYIVSATQPYKNANANYAIIYAFDPDWGWLRERQNQLDAYIQQGYANSSRQVLTETLNIMGLNWMLQSYIAAQTFATEVGALPYNYHRVGRMAQETGNGYYVDIYMGTGGSVSASGTSDNRTMEWTDLFSIFGSAMEHGIIEQLQNTNLLGASSVKILELANTNHQAVYLVNSTNWNAVQNNLVNYNLSDLANNFINPGFTLLLPQNGQIAVNGSGSWTGYGFEARRFSGGDTVVMKIGTGIYGGFVSDPTATVDPTFIDYSSYSQPLYFNYAPVSAPDFTSADPVNMADGTFQVQSTDLTLGQTEPRGLSFSRYYNSSRRNSNLAGIAPGWIHNYYLNAAKISAPQAGLGGTTPAQAAALLAATTAAQGVYNGLQPDPKNWLATALIAKWGVDQLTAKAVSISLGQSTIQFIQQPDGSFTPPANSTMTLTQTNGAYWLEERHGRTYQFNGAGWCTNIVDQYGQSLVLTYNSSNWVTKATDWKGRSLTFNYSSTAPVRLTSVVDSAGRSVSLAYTANNDLFSVTDPENKTITCSYDTNHQIAATFDASSQLVTSNVYNNFGRVITQLTQGDTNKTWHIFWSGWQTVSQDPAGGQQSYFYDDKTRLVGQQDALGNLTQRFYDGQDHVVTTISPLDEINQFIYDGNNNLIQTVDPLGSSNTFVYDGQNNLVQSLDPVGNPTTYGYNAKFQLIGQTNGAGDWANFAYDTGDGVLTSRTDPLGTTTYGYDSTYRRLNSITYPGGLGSESFANSVLGDVTNHTDARGFSTVYQYNARRQLTNTIAPTNLTVSVSFDAVGNQASVTDGRGFACTNIWTPTRHLSSIRLPATALGVAVTTNIYDSRDWLAKTLDPYQQPTLYTNDSAGRTISLTDPLQRTITTGYDSDGHQLFVVNAAHETNSQTWDANGRLIQLTDGAGHYSLRLHDPAGNQTILTNRNGKKWQFQFDGANRVHVVTTPLNRQTILIYNHAGLPASITDPANQLTSLYYDAKGRLTNRTDNVAATFYGYDVNDNGTTVVEGSATNVWTYDAYNRVSSYQDVNGFLIQYRYDASGNLTNLIYPGGKTVAYFYDGLNQLTNITDWAQRKTVIAYDLAGRVTSITRPNGTFRTWSYDVAGEMTNIWEQMANGLPIAWLRHNWNQNATMNWEFAAPLPHTNSVPTRTMTYDDDNRLKTFQGPSMSSAQNVGVDADGNLTSGPLTNDTFVSCVYDARNRLLNAGGGTNVYDALNNRVGQFYGTNATVFVVNPNGQLPQVLMRIKNGVTNYYVYGAGLLYQVTETATATNTLTYHYDYRGSTIALTGDNSLVTDRVEYSLYGSTTYHVGTNDTPFLFNGRYGVMTDANGLLYMRARYYNPYLCRFTSQDPSGFSGGLNFYAYANGNPASYLDPFGLGALESTVDLSWFNAPTPAQQEVQAELADFVNFVTLGVANIVSSATTGQDLNGNNLNVADAYQQTLEAGVFVGSLALSLPTDGASLEAETVLEGTTETAAEGAESQAIALTKFYPENNGFAGATERTFMMPGQTIDRYGGSGYSRFFSPQGTPDWARSLPPGTAGQPLRTFEVVKPFEVESGPVAPWFNQPGGGLQYRTPVNLDTLLKRGIIREITP